MPRVPKYRKRSDCDSAYVEMHRKRITLPGRAGSQESWEAYRQLVNGYLRDTKKKVKPSRAVHSWQITIHNLATAWLTHCKGYYGLSNTRSNEYDNCKFAIRPLVSLFGDDYVGEFDAEKLRQVREAAITGSWMPDEAPKRPIKPWPRTYANAQINRVKRMFRWGVAAKLVPYEVSAIVCALEPLKKGRTIAIETSPVSHVPDFVVDATLPYMHPIIRSMVSIHRLTGMRSDNLCSMRPCDIDRTGDVWFYTPSAHKGTHLDKSLVVPLGPKCQAILSIFFDRKPDMPFFSPREVVGRAIGRRSPGSRYTTNSYRNAVHRAVRKANKTAKEEAIKNGQKPPRPIPFWHPHQLRHSITQIAKRAAGLEGARAYLGHSDIRTTEIYEERDLALAVKIAREIG